MQEFKLGDRQQARPVCGITRMVADVGVPQWSPCNTNGARRGTTACFDKCPCEDSMRIATTINVNSSDDPRSAKVTPWMKTSI